MIPTFKILIFFFTNYTGGVLATMNFYVILIPWSSQLLSICDFLTVVRPTTDFFKCPKLYTTKISGEKEITPKKRKYSQIEITR